MTVLPLHTLVAVLIALTGAIVWLVRLEGRVNLIERLLEQHIESMEHTLTVMASKMDTMSRKLDDVMLNCTAWHAARNAQGQHKLGSPHEDH